MLTVISDYLTALAQLLKQAHLTAKDYQDHLLYERIQKGIDEDIDRIKEIALACGYSDEIANARQSLQNAVNVLDRFNSITELEQQTIIEINKIINKLNKENADEENISIDGVFNENVAKEGIINMLGDIAEKRTRDLYLLRFGGNQ